MRKIIIACDSFKDSLEAPAVCAAIAKGIQSVAPNSITEEVPLADGGEGTAKILSTFLGAEWHHYEVQDPIGRPIQAAFGWLVNSRTILIDMAAASGIQLLRQEERNPLEASTYGLGQLLTKALHFQPKRILLGIGGSATSDGGIGMAKALGFQFLDQSGNALSAKGEDLIKISHIQAPSAPIFPKDIEIQVLCDVSNPLYGPNGAAFVFGPQKGADANMVVQLDQGLKRLANCIQKDLNVDIHSLKGGGAAGGLGAGLHAFLGATLLPGIQTILDFIDFKNIMEGADLIITGEGKLDDQTAGGKLISGICELANQKNIPVIALCGTLLASPENIQKMGLEAAFSIINKPMSLEEALTSTANLLSDSSANLIKLLRLT